MKSSEVLRFTFMPFIDSPDLGYVACSVFCIGRVPRAVGLQIVAQADLLYSILKGREGADARGRARRGKPDETLDILKDCERIGRL